MRKLISLILIAFILISCAGFGAYADTPSAVSAVSAGQLQSLTLTYVGKAKGNKYTNGVTYYDGSTYCYLPDSNCTASSYIYYYPLYDEDLVTGYNPVSNAEISSSNSELVMLIGYDCGVGDTLGHLFTYSLGFYEIYYNNTSLDCPLYAEM